MYSRSTNIFSVAAPGKNAISSAHSASRECVWRKLPDSWAESAVYWGNGGVRALTADARQLWIEGARRLGRADALTSAAEAWTRMVRSTRPSAPTFCES